MNLDELECVAASATLGEWIWEDYGCGELRCRTFDDRTIIAGVGGEPLWMSVEDREYVSEARPSTMLDLIRRLRAAESSRDEWRLAALAAAAERDALLAEREEM